MSVACPMSSRRLHVACVSQLLSYKTNKFLFDDKKNYSRIKRFDKEMEKQKNENVVNNNNNTLVLNK